MFSRSHWVYILAILLGQAIALHGLAAETVRGGLENVTNDLVALILTALFYQLGKD